MIGQRVFLVGLAVVGAAGAVWLVSKTIGAPDLPVRAAAGARDTSGFQGYVIGADTAPVEVVEYADFQCPVCAGFDQVQWPDLKARLIDTGKIRFVHRDFPLDNPHPHARLAAHAAACASDQGKFWEAKSEIYRRHAEWNFAGQRDAYGVFGDIAASVGADRAAWEACMESGRHAARIQASLEEGMRLGVGSTPTFLIGGRLYTLSSTDQMARIVDSLITVRSTTP
jgi:protein-disulfide isomerase